MLSPPTEDFPLRCCPGATHLLGALHLLVVGQVGALQSRADDGQAFAGLQLVGEREEARLLHVLLAVRADQHQQLGPEGREEKEKKKLRLKKKKKTKDRQKKGQTCSSGRVLTRKWQSDKERRGSRGVTGRRANRNSTRVAAACRL